MLEMNHNMLIDELPRTVMISGAEVQIETNFRTGILFELMMQDDTVDDAQKIITALRMFYGDRPFNVDEAIDQILWFYSCGKEWRKDNDPDSGADDGVNRIYSYEHDDDYIYSAFLSQYGIDLQDVEYLHWWKFKSMFHGLSEDQEIVKIMGYRGMKISSKMSREQRRFYEKMQRMYALPIPDGEREKYEAITDALMNGGDLTGLL